MVVLNNANLVAESQTKPSETFLVEIDRDAEFTNVASFPGSLVSQAFCSALPVRYHGGEGFGGASWQPLAALVLEAAYEATLWSAVMNAQRGASRTVLLTMPGGGAFGNDEGWVRAAMQHAITTVGTHGLDVVLVVVEVLRLAQLDVRTGVGAHSLDGRCVGAALVDGALLRHSVQFDGAFEESPRRSVVSVSTKQKVDRGTGTVDASVQVLPLAADFDVGFVHCQLMPTGRLRRRNTTASTGTILIDHRWTVA